MRRPLGALRRPRRSVHRFHVLLPQQISHRDRRPETDGRFPPQSPNSGDARTDDFPTRDGKKLLRIRSVGRAGRARRTVSVLAARNPGGASFVVLADVDKAVECSGSCLLNLAPATLHVNSSRSKAINTIGSGAIVPGDVNVKGNCSGTCNITPTPNVDVDPIPDPLAYLQAMEPPRPGALPVRSDAGAVLLPGYYPSGITVSSTAKTVAPGLYVLGPGKKLTISGGGSLTGTAPGVTFFGDEFVISGGSSLNLTAPSSGNYRGILLWQSAASSKKMVFSGTSTGTIEGAIYNPNGMLELSGGSGAMKLEFVVDRLTVSGPSSITQVSAPVLRGSGGYQVGGWSDLEP